MQELDRRDSRLNTFSPSRHLLTNQETMLVHCLSQMDRSSAFKPVTIIFTSNNPSAFGMNHHPKWARNASFDFDASQALVQMRPPISHNLPSDLQISPGAQSVVRSTFNAFHQLQKAAAYIGFGDMDMPVSEKLQIIHRLEQNHRQQMRDINRAMAMTLTGGPERCLISTANLVHEGLTNHRLQGSLQMINGLAECRTGAYFTQTGVGAIIGVPLILHGADHAVTGAKMMTTGEYHQTLTSYALIKMGMPPEYAHALDQGVNAGAGLGVGIAARASQTAMERIWVLPPLTEYTLTDCWTLPVRGGGTYINGRYYTEHALERMAPRTPQVMAILEKRYKVRERIARAHKNPEDFKKWQIDNFPNPRGVPPSVVEAEITRSGSTNVFISINKNGDVITVIPRSK